MKTLYQRLKPEFKEALKKHAEKYPQTVQEVVDELKEKDYIPELVYGTYVELESASLIQGLGVGRSLFEYFND